MNHSVEDAHVHGGHRGRMRAKLLNHGDRIFDTYELLELLLYNVIPYKDTNPIAKRLLSVFGSLDGVFSADRESLMTVSGIGERVADYLIEVGKLSYIIGSELLPAAKVDFNNYDSVGEFFAEHFANNPELRLSVLTLDNSMHPINVEDVPGDVKFATAACKPALFMDIAIRERASVIITAQNNYYGPYCPTPGDRATSDMISDALASINVTHLEHYLICGKRYMGISNAKAYRFLASPPVLEFEKSRESALEKEMGEMGGFCDE